MKLLNWILLAAFAVGGSTAACQPLEEADSSDDSNETKTRDKTTDDTEEGDASPQNPGNDSDSDAGNMGSNPADAGDQLDVEEPADDVDAGAGNAKTADSGAPKSPQSPDDGKTAESDASGPDSREDSAPAEWSDGFEGGFGDWSVEGGLWAFGEPTFDGGPEALNGKRVAGTNLAGNYEEGQDARLISPQFKIDEDAPNPRFKFAYWHALNLGDYGQVEVSVDGADWEPAFDAKMIGETGGWGQQVVLLRQYAGSRVRVAIRLVSTNLSGGPVDVGAGIYVDDAVFETSETSLDTDDFESGLGDWSVEGGNWAKGEPAEGVGPVPLSGKQVLGTHLGGNYLDNNGDVAFETRSRLVSPEFSINDGDDNPRFKLAYWHELNLGDHGQFQVSVDGQPWVDLQDDPIIGSSGGWGQRVVPLRKYAGSRVRIGLLLATSNQSGGPVDVAPGIYVDDAAYETGEMTLDTDDFEGGLGDWSVEGGNWGIGAPEEGFGPQPLSGAHVMGTNLGGNYWDNNGSIDFETRARLVSPELFIDESFEAPRFRIAFWHELSGGDTGRFQISVNQGPWNDLPGDLMTGDSGAWGQRVVELHEYAGERVRVGLLLSTTNQSGGPVDVASGLYVDDASFVTD